MAISKWEIKSNVSITHSDEGFVNFFGEEDIYEATYEDALIRLGEKSKYQVFNDIVITLLANLHAYGRYD